MPFLRCTCSSCTGPKKYYTPRGFYPTTTVPTIINSDKYYNIFLLYFLARSLSFLCILLSGAKKEVEDCGFSSSEMCPVLMGERLLAFRRTYYLRFEGLSSRNEWRPFKLKMTPSFELSETT